MKNFKMMALVSVSMLGFSTPAWAQTTGDAEATVADDIVVTARRRDESKQDVPLVVQAVSAQELSKFNVREFKDVAALVPGLSLSQDANGIAAQATMRGIAFNVNASGNNGTIEFYLNDAPLSAAILYQSMFDVGQIEVLRGPQGTLRGRASPSGSITVTTRRPDLSGVGATVNSTVNSWGDVNIQGAINVPIVEDKLGVRIAGVYDENDDSRVDSINFNGKPSRETRGGRVSVRFEPFDSLSLNASYNVTDRKVTSFDQVESGNIANPALAASPVTITASDRNSVLRVPRLYEQLFKVWNWSAEWRVLGQKVNYVGSHNAQNYDSVDPNDKGAALPITAPAAYIGAAQVTATRARQTNHEIRLSSDERIAGMFDYVVGYLHNKLDNPTTLDVQTPVFLGSVATPLLVNHTAVLRGGGSRERSMFANLTAHIGEANEISGGVRRISYRSLGSLSLGGVAVAAATEDRKMHATIFSASAKHKFNEDLMVYANFGSSWRPGSATNSIQTRSQPNITGNLAAYLYPDPEKSKSYEVGVKSTWLDGKLVLNLNYFHQDFKNFAFSANNVFYLTTAGGVNGVGTATTFTTGVPAKVDGVEAEIGLRVIPNLSIDATMAYSKGKIGGGIIACNTYGGVPTAAQILATGQQMAFCDAPSGLRAGNSAPFVATVQSEYNHQLSGSMDGYLRGLLTYNGKSLNDPTNLVDNIKAYALANLYAGVRDQDGAWELGLYVKNVFDVERVLTRNATTFTSGASVAGGGVSPVSTYRGISMTAPREFGVTFRMGIGTR
jgi:iron complex outermembrane receptor protein